MMLHYALLTYQPSGSTRRPRVVGLLVHDGRRTQVHSMGRNRDHAIGLFRNLASDKAAAAWVYGEWVDWLEALARESQDSVSKLMTLVDHEASSGQGGPFRISRLRTQTISGPRERAVGALVARRLARPSWNPSPLAVLLEDLIDSAQLPCVNGFHRDVLLRIEEGPLSGRSGKFDVVMDSRPRIAIIAIDATASARQFAAARRAAAGAFEVAVVSGWIAAHRCIIAIDVDQIPNASVEQVYRQFEGFRFIDLGDGSAGARLRAFAQGKRKDVY